MLSCHYQQTYTRKHDFTMFARLRCIEKKSGANKFIKGCVAINATSVGKTSRRNVFALSCMVVVAVLVFWFFRCRDVGGLFIQF